MTAANSLTFPGDQTRFDPDHLFGPDRFGAVYAPVSATYDAAADRTTIALRPLPPAELQGRRAAALDQLIDKARLVELFGGEL